jgi:hypothetical protein
MHYDINSPHFVWLRELMRDFIRVLCMHQMIALEGPSNKARVANLLQIFYQKMILV